MRAMWLGIFLICVCGTVSAQQDTVLMIRLPEVDVTASRLWENDKERYRYNQTKLYVKTILPYLNAATKLFNEINVKANDPDISKKERRQFINSKEDELRDRFENEVKKLNVTQGGLLVTLIARQTGANIYSILQEFKNPLTAIRWQTWAKFNGYNLNKIYRPEEEPLLEDIMSSLGYPLPDMYGQKQTAATLHLH